MISSLRASTAAFTASICVFAAACGGTSISHGDAGGMAGLSESGGSGTTGGSSGHAGSGAHGGSGGTNSTGGTTSTGGVGGSGAVGGTSAVGGTGALGGTGAVGGAGGTTGKAGAGSGGISGSAGDVGVAGSGTTECVTGGMCTTEGARCSENACCSCSHTCQGGVWNSGICPPCAAPICPQSPPSNGDMCSTCGVPADGCMWDQRPTDGPLYTAQCVDERWLVKTTRGSGCCSTDDDCAPSVCVNGQCQYAVPGQCWRDADCGMGRACSSVHACGCQGGCTLPNAAGVCVPVGTDCCLTDTDCTAPSYCLEGACKLPPSRGASSPGCWTDRDCTNGGYCEGANVCPCGSACLVADSPGSCVYPL